MWETKESSNIYFLYKIHSGYSAPTVVGKIEYGLFDRRSTKLGSGYLLTVLIMDLMFTSLYVTVIHALSEQYSRTDLYCSASEFRHPSEVRHTHFMAVLKSFCCELSAHMYTLLLKAAIPFI